MEDEVQPVELPARLAVVPVNAAVQLQNLPAAGGLMQPVDVLGDDGLQLSRRLQLRQLPVGGVGLGLRRQHLRPVEAEKFLRVAFVKAMA